MKNLDLNKIVVFSILFFFFLPFGKSQSSFEKLNQFSPEFSLYDFYTEKQRLIYSIPDLLEINDERLLNLENSLKTFNQTQRKVFLWDNFHSIEFCNNCSKKGCFVERFLLPFENEIVNFYIEIGYPEHDISIIKSYFEDLKTGRITRKRWFEVTEDERLELVNNYILKNINSLVKSPSGKQFDLNYSGWLVDSLFQNEGYTRKKGIYKIRVEKGVVIERNHYSFNNVLLVKDIYKSKPVSYVFYKSGQLKEEKKTKKISAEEIEIYNKTYYPTGELFSEFWKGHYLVQYVGTSGEDEKLITYYKNGQKAYEKNGFRFPEAWDSLGNKTIENKTGYVVKWGLSNGELVQESYSQYEGGKPVGNHYKFKNGKLNQYSEYKNGKLLKNEMYYLDGKAKYVYTYGSKERNINYFPSIDSLNFYLNFEIFDASSCEIHLGNDEHIFRIASPPDPVDTIWFPLWNFEKLAFVEAQYMNVYVHTEKIAYAYLKFDHMHQIVESDLEIEKEAKEFISESQLLNELKKIEFRNFPQIKEGEILKLGARINVGFKIPD